MENIRNIIESLLFVADEPLTVDKIKRVLETADAKEIRTNLNALADQYEARGGGFRLTEVAGGWQLRSRPEYNEYIKRLLQPSPQRLSRAALETLAIVAYNQPIIRADIEHIRGVDCGGMLRQLLERKLIRVLGRKEIPGRPLIYATSKLFLELFELKNLKDLPTPKEIEEISAPGKKPPVGQDEDRDPAALSHAGDPGTPLPQPVPSHPTHADVDTPALGEQALDAGYQRGHQPGGRQHQRFGHPTRIATGPPQIASHPHKIAVESSKLGAADPMVKGQTTPISGPTSDTNPAHRPDKKDAGK